MVPTPFKEGEHSGQFSENCEKSFDFKKPQNMAKN
jgi:hypothetical protein